MFFETLVILGVDFKVVEVISVETPGVVILDATMCFTVVTVPFFETEETGAIDGFITWLEDSLACLKATREVFPVELALEFSRDSALCLWTKTVLFVFGGKQRQNPSQGLGPTRQKEKPAAPWIYGSPEASANFMAFSMFTTFFPTREKGKGTMTTADSSQGNHPPACPPTQRQTNTEDNFMHCGWECKLVQPLWKTV